VKAKVEVKAEERGRRRGEALQISDWRLQIGQGGESEDRRGRKEERGGRREERGERREE